MLKKLVATGVVMAFLGGILFAKDYEGSIRKIEPGKDEGTGTITANVKVAGSDDAFAERKFTYTKDTTFKGKVGKKNNKVPLSVDAITTALATKRGMKRGLAAKFTTDGESTKLTSVKAAKKNRKKKAASE